MVQPITSHRSNLARTFRRAREEEYPWASRTTYLNAASIGPLPERTCRMVNEFTRRRADPAGLTDEELGAVLARARNAAARLIGASPDEIALATNTSFGINLAARCLPLQAGEVIVVSRDEFPANVYPWLQATRERGIEVELVPTLANGWPDEQRLLERVADQRVRVIAVSHVQFHNGYRIDLDALGKVCRREGVFLVVDAIQALGQIPFDVRRTPVDVMACGAQKWLLSPWGSGFVYVRRELLDVMDPAVVGWMAFEGTDDVSRLTEYGTTLRADARRFELNTLPFQDLAGMASSIEFLLELGVERIAAHLTEVNRPLLDDGRRGFYELMSPDEERRGSAIIAVRTADVERSYGRLRDAGVVCSVREGALRFSPHWYNTADEMERVATIVRAT